MKLENLEIGMYCYNKINRKLGIGKIISFQSNNNVNVRYKNDIELVNIGNIIASHNITDLIEVGDYVNGYQVVEKPYIYQNIEFVSVDTQDSWSWGKGEMPCTEIKTILTHEQFENNCYKIGD